MAEADPYARIDTALDRIDAALKRPDPEVIRLRRRHDRLRASVEEAVAALDALAAPTPAARGAADLFEAGDGEPGDPRD